MQGCLTPVPPQEIPKMGGGFTSKGLSFRVPKIRIVRFLGVDIGIPSFGNTMGDCRALTSSISLLATCVASHYLEVQVITGSYAPIIIGL